MTVWWDTPVEVLLDMLIEGCFVWEDGSLATGVNACVSGNACSASDRIVFVSRRKKKTYPAPALPPCMKYASGCKLGTGLMFDWSVFVCQVAGKEALFHAKKGLVG